MEINEHYTTTPEEQFPQPEDRADKKVVIELQDVKRNFIVGDETVHALKGVSFKIYEGEFVTIRVSQHCSISLDVLILHRVENTIWME